MAVHDFHDPELRNGRAYLDDGRWLSGKTNQDADCSTEFTGKNLTKIVKTCHADKLCRVVGVVGPNGWKYIIKVEDYSDQQKRLHCPDITYYPVCKDGKCECRDAI